MSSSSVMFSTRQLHAASSRSWNPPVELNQPPSGAGGLLEECPELGIPQYAASAQ